MKGFYNFIYKVIPIGLGLIGVFGEVPMPFFIFSLWLAVIGLAYYKNDKGLLKTFMPDYEKVKASNRKMSITMFVLSLGMLILGTLEIYL